MRENMKPCEGKHETLPHEYCCARCLCCGGATRMVVSSAARLRYHDMSQSDSNIMHVAEQEAEHDASGYMPIPD